MLNGKQLSVMLELQDRLNKVVNPDWLAANYPWGRAILVETVEAIEHHGWKWWKAQTPNMPALHMELVDIWHFMLSMALQQNRGNLALTTFELETELELASRVPVVERYELLDYLQQLAGSAGYGELNLECFCRILEKAGLAWEALYEQYVGKNVLNLFRQAHGYKEGTYIKMWPGEGEDNDFLTRVLEELDPKDEHFAEQIASRLEERYSTIAA